MTIHPGITAGGFVLAALLGTFLLSASKEIGKLEEALVTQVQETEEAVTANGTNLATIDELLAANEVLVAQRRADTAERERELAERTAELIASQNEAAAARRDRDEILRSTESCEAYSQVVVADLCPGIATELRQRSLGSGSN